MDALEHAAAEIAELRDEVRKLRAALQDIEAIADREDYFISPAAAEMARTASTALNDVYPDRHTTI